MLSGLLEQHALHIVIVHLSVAQTCAAVETSVFHRNLHARERPAGSAEGKAKARSAFVAGYALRPV